MARGGGRPAVPTALKVLRGNPGRRPLNKQEPQAARGLLEPPTFLDEEARVEWLRIAPLLEECGLLTKVDRAGLTQYCVAWSEYVQSRQPGVGMDRRRLAFSHLLRILVEFGLTPSSRSRIKVDRPEPASELDAFKAKHG